MSDGGLFNFPLSKKVKVPARNSFPIPVGKLAVLEDAVSKNAVPRRASTIRPNQNASASQSSTVRQPKRPHSALNDRLFGNIRSAGFAQFASQPLPSTSSRALTDSTEKDENEDELDSNRDWNGVDGEDDKSDEEETENQLEVQPLSPPSASSRPSTPGGQQPAEDEDEDEDVSEFKEKIQFSEETQKLLDPSSPPREAASEQDDLDLPDVDDILYNGAKNEEIEYDINCSSFKSSAKRKRGQTKETATFSTPTPSKKALASFVPIDCEMIDLVTPSPPPSKSRHTSTQSATLNPSLSPAAKRRKVTPREKSSEHQEEEKSELSPPNKSVPTQIASPKKAVAPARHPVYWFLDGNVVIRIHGAPRPTIFKLHKSPLTRKSDVLDKLLQTENATGEVIDDCPVFDIPADCPLQAQDFASLLGAIEDGIMYAMQPPAFSVLSSILRASTILKFQNVQKWAHASIEKMWEFDLNEPRYRRANAKETILLARSLGGMLDGVLKAAFYELLKRDSFGMDALEKEQELLSTLEKKGPRSKNIKKQHGRISHFQAPAIHITDKVADDTACANELSMADVQRLVSTREKLVGHWMGVLSLPVYKCGTMLTVPQNTPKDPAVEEASSGSTAPEVPNEVHTIQTPCSDRLRSLWLDLVYKRGLLEDFLYDPLAGYETLNEACTEWEARGDVLCGACAHNYRSDWRKGRDKVWKLLETWLSL